MIILPPIFILASSLIYTVFNEESVNFQLIFSMEIYVDGFETTETVFVSNCPYIESFQKFPVNSIFEFISRLRNENQNPSFCIFSNIYPLHLTLKMKGIEIILKDVSKCSWEGLFKNSPIPSAHNSSICKKSTTEIKLQNHFHS